MNYPTIRQMQYLVALRAHKSFLKAAQECAVSQPAFSTGIRDMEKILGQPLIDRSKRKVILTPLGHKIAEEAQEILNRAERMADHARRLAAPMTGALRLGVIPTIAPYLLPDVLPRVQRQYPLLELQLYEDMTDRLLERLRAGDIDAALMAFPHETPDLSQKILFDEEFLLAVPKDRAFQAKTLTPSDLDPGELLLLEDGHCLSDHALSACGLQLPRRRKAYSATSLFTLLQMVSNGYGITLVPDMAVAARAVPKGVKLLRFVFPPPTRQIGLVWRPGSPQIEDFMRLGKIIGST